MRNWIYGLVLAAATSILLLKAADRVARRAGRLPDIPRPNAYEELLRVAEQLKKFEKEPSEMTREEAIRTASTERALLEPVHSLVRTNSAVPLKTMAGWGDEHETQVKKLKRLTVALAMQARAHEVSGDTNLAGRALLDIVFLGHLMARGGIYVDAVNSLAVETLGVGMLRPKVRLLDAPSSRWAARELEALEERREPPEAILEREKAWSHASFGLVSRIGGLLRRSAEASRRTRLLEKYHETARRTRHLILALGAHAYEREKGRSAARPDELVPDILKAVPVDPVGRESFKDLPQLDAPL